MIIKTSTSGVPAPHIRHQAHQSRPAELDLLASGIIVQPKPGVNPTQVGNAGGWLLRLLRLSLIAAVIAGAAMAVADIQRGAVRGVVVPAATEARLAAVETWQAVTGSTGP